MSGTRNKIRELLRRSDICHYCKCSLNDKSATLDHIIPKAKGGTMAYENVVLCCEPCNKRKADMSYWKFMATLGRTPDTEYGPEAG